MRLSYQDLPILSLCFLPLVISFYKFSVITTIIIILLWGLFKLFIKFAGPEPPKKLKLNSILISHYSEKVRWCLEYCNIEFEEEFDSAIFGILFFNRSIPTLYNPSARTTVGNSSDILRYIYGSYCAQNDKVSKLLTPTKESLEMESLFDAKLGRAIQRIFYFELYRTESLKDTMLICWGSKSDKIPFYQKILLQILFPVYKHALRHFLNLNEKTYKNSMSDIEEIFELVEKRLSKNKFIMGDELTFVDITFCSLAAHLIIDGNTFANGLIKDDWPNFEDSKELQNLELYKHVKKFRKMKAAQFVRDVYKNHRNC